MSVIVSSRISIDGAERSFGGAGDGAEVDEDGMLGDFDDGIVVNEEYPDR